MKITISFSLSCPVTCASDNLLTIQIPYYSLSLSFSKIVGLKSQTFKQRLFISVSTYRLKIAGAQAMTNSPGSLALRDAPSMGAGKLDFRVPNKSLLNILEYSENSIILDGKKSRFVLIEYQGQQGWILESYLNFN